MKSALYNLKSCFLKFSELSSEKKALSAIAGFYLGLFPLTGVTTLLCQLAVIRFRLNTLIVQSINILLSPLQVLLMYPMMKTGRIVFYNDHRVIPEISLWLEGSLFGGEIMLYFLETVFGGMLIWSIVVLFTGFFFYRMLLKVVSGIG